MIARDEHLHAATRRLAKERERRRPAKPLHSELAEGGFIARDLVENRRFRAPMRQQIDEVEDARPDAVGGEEAAQPPLEVIGFGRGRDLLITDRNTPTELAQLRIEQLPLVGVE